MIRRDFTLAGYRDLIGGLLAQSYQLRSFSDAAPRQRHLLLRHDVDQSIPIARAMAEAESAQGWRSSWQGSRRWRQWSRSEPSCPQRR